MPFLQAADLSKSFRASAHSEERVAVVRDLSFQLEEGELVTLFGPNGCGKTTILNILAGIVQPDSGQVHLNSANPDDMPVGYVFQNYTDTLLPWRTVRSNIAFPLEIRRVPRTDMDGRVSKRLAQFGLTEHADKYVYDLSGGLKQLTSIARSTIYEPRLLLLDEPFSALDYSVSRMMWTTFRQFWADSKVTTLFVSHNVDEAIFLGDRVLVLSPRPSQIVAEIRVPFGNGRRLDLLSSQEFFALRNEVLSAFEQGRTQ